MPGPLILKFDANQEHQRQAIDALVGLFQGLSHQETEFKLGGELVPNLPASSALERTWLFENLLSVQERNQVPLSARLEQHSEVVLDGAGYESWNWPSFTIEMETGTGKTYVYLRTIYELRRRYGFGKFVVVVPSVAIYEGVVKSFEITRAHLRSLYENEPVNLIRYEGAALSRLRGFAQSNGCEILVITLDAFNKASGRSTNVIYRASEKLPGALKPFQYIQETRPILILDEPMAGLDVESEAVVRDALKCLMTGRTCVLITHDLEAVADADLILTLDDGRIVEQGTHGELLSGRSRYRELIDRQGNTASFEEKERAIAGRLVSLLPKVGQ